MTDQDYKRARLQADIERGIIQALRRTDDPIPYTTSGVKQVTEAVSLALQSVAASYWGDDSAEVTVALTGELTASEEMRTFHIPAGKIQWIKLDEGTQNSLVNSIPDSKPVYKDVSGSFKTPNRGFEQLNLKLGQASGSSKQPLCPDCKGTGIYIGLDSREPCATCQ